MDSIDNFVPKKKISGENNSRQKELSAQREAALVTKREINLSTDENLGDGVIEDQLEIKEENVLENENEPETILPDVSLTRTWGDKTLNAHEESPSYATTIKPEEIDSDLDDSETVHSFTNSTQGPITRSTIQSSNTVPRTLSKLVRKRSKTRGPTISNILADRWSRSVATQTNFDDVKSYSKHKVIFITSNFSNKPKSSSVIQGRRIIDLNHFFKELLCANNHSLLGCNLNNCVITLERKVGLCTGYFLKCTMCDFRKMIWSENLSKKETINSDFVSAMLSINSNFETINALLAKMHLPLFTQSRFSIVSRKCLSRIKKTLNSSQRNVKKKLPVITPQKTLNSSQGNVKKKLPVITPQKCISSVSNESKRTGQIIEGDLIIKDQFEIKEGNVCESGNKFGTIIPDIPQQTQVFARKSQPQISLHEQVSLQVSNAMIQNTQDNNEPIKLEFNNKKINDRESMTTFDNRFYKKAKVVACEGRVDIKEEPSEKLNKFLVPKSDASSPTITQKMSPDIAEGIKQGGTRIVYLLQKPSLTHQNAGKSSHRLLHSSSFVENDSASSNNEQFILPDIMESTYMPDDPTALQLPQNLPDAANETMIIPLLPAAVPQPTSLANRPPLNTEPSRWIGRANMESNSFFTLPGGAPKGVSNPVPTRPDNKKSNYHCKRQQLHCDDCNISFKNYESCDYHKKSSCIKRVKLSPSSTVTSDMLINNPLESTHVNNSNEVTQPCVKELLSAMAIKRLYLEASLKTALDTQYIINLHKSAQDLTQKSLKELDDALNRENALTSNASLEEQQIASEARGQALMKTEAAYKQEKHFASAVEQALYRQKEAIEAAVTATGHEQTVLISTLQNFKGKADKIDLPTIHHALYDHNLTDVTSFKQEKLIGTALAQTTEQQVPDNISSR